jgi:hypothetical protein
MVEIESQKGGTVKKEDAEIYCYICEEVMSLSSRLWTRATIVAALVRRKEPYRGKAWLRIAIRSINTSYSSRIDNETFASGSQEANPGADASLIRLGFE